jgi:sulfotransferase
MATGSRAETDIMDKGIHFISGLPRSGSTLLSALLRQNRRFHASMTSPVGSLVMTLMRQMSQENETALFVDDVQRLRVLRSCVDGYYWDIHPNRLVFDTNRVWASKLQTVARLFPDARMICCVRSPAWVLDSIERLVRRNSLEPSGLFKFDPTSTVYSRVESQMSAGMVGVSLQGLLEAVFDERRDRLMLVRYETLTLDPRSTLKAIYDFIGEPIFDHDPEHVEQDYDALAFDAKIGAPGLHKVGAQVKAIQRETILPTEIFAKYENAFWNAPEGMPSGVRLV